MPENRANKNKVQEQYRKLANGYQGEKRGFVLRLLDLFDKLQQRISHEVLLFALAYLVLLVIMTVFKDKIVVELKVILTLLPLLALVVYAFLIGKRRGDQLIYLRKENKHLRRNIMGSNVSDREQYQRLLGYLNKLTENEFLDAKQYLLKIEEINTGSGTSRVHFMSDIRVRGKMDELEKYLLDQYKSRLIK